MPASPRRPATARHPNSRGGISTLRPLVVALVGVALSHAAVAAGFQWVTAPDAADRPLELAVWYPSNAPTSPQPLGLFEQEVASYAEVTGRGLPLIVISHGTGGGANNHYDTALALAEAGFVVAAPTHTGDNYRDRDYSFTRRQFVDRPRHLSRVIDFMVNLWAGHDRLNRAQIGAFGHSAGGTTVLIAIGGTPDLSRVAPFCLDHPDAWDCQRVKEKSSSDPAPEAKDPAWPHDPRIRAAVIAAPAIGYTFTAAGLAPVNAPIQLWQAEADRIAPNQWNAEFIKAALPKPPEDHLVPLAGHFAFLAPCSVALAAVAPEICQDPPGFDRAVFHAEFNQAVVAFFKAQLAPPR